MIKCEYAICFSDGRVVEKVITGDTYEELQNKVDEDVDILESMDYDIEEVITRMEEMKDEN